MSDRKAFDLLQDRWASGDTLSVEEDQARLDFAATDELARRELEIFGELQQRLDAADDEVPNVASALARARGVKLRVVAPGEGKSERGSSRFGRRSLGVAAAALGVAAAAALVVFRSHVPGAPLAKAPAAPPAAAAARVEALRAARSELVFASGEVTVDGERAGVGGPTLAVGSNLRTREGRACLSVDPGIDVCLGPSSEALLESLTPADIRVRVTLGTAVASLSPRSAGHTFSLVSGDVAATAHGTVFALEAGAAAPVRVTVLEGSVAVARSGGASRLLDAHSSLRLGSRPGEPLVEALGRGEEARLYAWLAPKDLGRGSKLGVLEVAEQGGLRALVDDQGPYALPLRVYVSAGRHRVALRPAAGADTLVDTDVEAGAVRRVEADAAVSREEGMPSARALLEQARDRLSSGDSRGARALYERLRRTHPTSPEAHTVLVSLGKLELDGGAPERALALFDAYVKGGGSLLPEALSGRIRALRALGQSTDERRAIERYLASYPKSFEVPALEKRLSALAAP